MLALHCYICRVFPFFSTRELFGSVFLCGTCTLYSMCTELWVPCQHPAQVTAAAARIGQNVDEHPRSNPLFFFTPLQANFLLRKDLFFIVTQWLMPAEVLSLTITLTLSADSPFFYPRSDSVTCVSTWSDHWCWLQSPSFITPTGPREVRWVCGAESHACASDDLSWTSR